MKITKTKAPRTDNPRSIQAVKAHVLDQQVKRYLIDLITVPEGYDAAPTTQAEYIDFARRAFEREMRHEISYYGKLKAIDNWLQGLCSVVPVEFRNYEIVQLGIDWGALPMHPSDCQARRWLDNWFNLLASKLLQIFTGYNVPKPQEG